MTPPVRRRTPRRPDTGPVVGGGHEGEGPAVRWACPDLLAGSKTGVFMGAFTEDIKVFWLNERNRDLFGPHTGTGAAMTMERTSAAD